MILGLLIIAGTVMFVAMLKADDQRHEARMDRIYAEHLPEVDRNCLDCPPGPPAGEAETCPRSERACGHHCNHAWTHDNCCWCERSWAL